MNIINEKEYDDEDRNIILEFADFNLVNSYIPNIKRDLSRIVS